MRSEPLPLADLAPRRRPHPRAARERSTGGLASQVVRVFAENRLAIVGALIIVGMVLFCFVGPLFYSTNQTSTQDALLYSTQNSPPERGPPARHGPERLRRARPDHVRRSGLARGGLRGGSARHDRRRALRSDLRLLRRLGRRTHDAHRRRAAVGAAPLPRDRARGDLPAVARDPHPGHRLHRMAGACPPGPRRDAVAARARVRAGRARHGRRATSASCCATSSPTRSARSSSTPRSRSPMRSCCSRRSGSSASGCRRRRPTGDRCSPTASNSALNGYWWQIYPAGVAIVLVVVAFNFVGDALRDAFEVRLQRR